MKSALAAVILFCAVSAYAITNDCVHIVFLGDVCCKPQQISLIEKGGRSYDEIFASASKLYKHSDYVVANLETPIAGAELRYSSSSACFNTPIGFAKAAKDSGISFVTTANNHSMDRGIAGCGRTLDSLDKIGLEHTGTYRSQGESKAVKVVEVCGVRIALVTATYGTNTKYGADILPPDVDWMVDMLKKQELPIALQQKHKNISFLQRVKKKILSAVPGRMRSSLSVLVHGQRPIQYAPKQDYMADCVPRSEITNTVSLAYLERYLEKIRHAKLVSDVIVALPHIGGQYNPAPGYYHKFIVDQSIAAGADIVIANHAHVPLPIKVTDDGILIAHALGNFCFTPYVDWFLDHVFSEYNIVLHIWLDVRSKRLVRYEYEVLKNVVEPDGFAHPVPVPDLLKQVNNDYEEERLTVEYEAVRNIVGPSAKNLK